MAKDSDERNKIVEKVLQQFADRAVDVVRVAQPVQTPLVNKIVVSVLIAVVCGGSGWTIARLYARQDKQDERLLSHEQLNGHPTVVERTVACMDALERQDEKLDAIQYNQATILSEIKKNGGG